MKHWITYHPDPVHSPMSRHGWVRGRLVYTNETEARLPQGMLDYEATRNVPGKGYPYFHVLFDDFEWQFASFNEMDIAIATLSAKNMARVRSLNWWRNRLPGGLMSWRKRERLVRALRTARQAFAQELGWR